MNLEKDSLEKITNLIEWNSYFKKLESLIFIIPMIII